MSTVINTRNEWIEYLTELRPDLSAGSKKAYGSQLVKISLMNNIKDPTPLSLLNRLANKVIRDRSLKFIFGDLTSNQSRNLRIASVLSILKENKANINPKKYKKLFETLKKVGKELRDVIT